MKKWRSFVLVLACWTLVATAPTLAGHGGKDDKGPAILLVTFGTTVPQARAAFDAIEKRVKTAFPEVPVRWAYTSSVVRKKLAGQGVSLDSPEMALARLMDEGHSRIAVQSLHMMTGIEFHELHVNAMKFGEMRGGPKKIAVGMPLLSSDADLELVADTLMTLLPSERKPEEAVVLMGHGSHHPSDAVFSAMMYKFQKRDPNVFVGTVEGHPDVEDIKGQLLAKGIKKAYLVPFMSVAGDHATNDLAGDEPDSWKSLLTAAGVACVPVLKGMAEYDAIADIWVAHLKETMNSAR